MNLFQLRRIKGIDFLLKDRAKLEAINNYQDGNVLAPNAYNTVATGLDRRREMRRLYMA